MGRAKFEMILTAGNTAAASCHKVDVIPVYTMEFTPETTLDDENFSSCPVAASILAAEHNRHKLVADKGKTHQWEIWHQHRNLQSSISKKHDVL